MKGRVHDSRVIRMMLQVVPSSTIIILMTLDVSFILLENIYSTGIACKHHLRSSKYLLVQATGDKMKSVPAGSNFYTALDIMFKIYFGINLKFHS